MKICFTSTAENAYSETFIANLTHFLPGEVHHCYGGRIPNVSKDGTLKNYKQASIFELAKWKLGWIKRPLNQHYFLQYLKKERFDLLFVNYGTAGAELAPLAEASNTPLLVHFHGYDASVLAVIERYRKPYKEMFRIARAIIGVSHEMAGDLIALGVPTEKLRIISCFPNERFLVVKPNYTGNQILAIGRFVEKKAPYLTLIAFMKAKEVCPSLRLVFIGEGDLLPICKDLCRSMKIQDVTFLGILSPEEIVKEMERSFCFVQHSKRALDGDKEGTPVAISEALAAGLPVISTRHAGIPDIVRDGENGFLVEEGDIEGMSDRLIRVWQDKGLAERMGKDAKEHFAQLFKSDMYRTSWEKVFNSI
jgi:colanic acid/amylovoran biosynthesis glycosyltransferase